VPTSNSSRKRVRQNAKRRALNNWRKRQIKGQVKSCLTAIQEQDVKTAEIEFRKTCGLLDRTATTSTMHRNTAARRKRRLAKGLNHLKEVTQ